MALRDKIRNTFSRRSSNSSKSSSKSSSSSRSSDPSDRSSSIWYQPGEKIPYKYRRPVEPAHQAKLNSFSWSTAWRRQSISSQYSPMGSRMPSRRGSMVGGNEWGMPPDAIHDENVGPLEMIESVSSMGTRIESVESSQTVDSSFTQSELDAAVRKANVAS